jgi:hypothetical protein
MNTVACEFASKHLGDQRRSPPVCSGYGECMCGRSCLPSPGFGVWWAPARRRVRVWKGSYAVDVRFLRCVMREGGMQNAE